MCWGDRQWIGVAEFELVETVSVVFAGRVVSVIRPMMRRIVGVVLHPCLDIAIKIRSIDGPIGSNEFIEVIRIDRAVLKRFQGEERNTEPFQFGNKRAVRVDETGLEDVDDVLIGDPHPARECFALERPGIGRCVSIA